ncbi:MAG: hypothetical protein ACRDKS_01485 [Actinomycetota bacterium]
MEYQLFHVNNYSHLVKVTIEPLVDVDGAFEPTYAEIRAKG